MLKLIGWKLRSTISLSIMKSSLDVKLYMTNRKSKRANSLKGKRKLNYSRTRKWSLKVRLINWRIMIMSRFLV